MLHAERAETAAALLKFISPADAKLIDKAIGTRVRLRKVSTKKSSEMFQL